jgi:hypothetical protein
VDRNLLLPLIWSARAHTKNSQLESQPAPWTGWRNGVIFNGMIHISGTRSPDPPKEVLGVLLWVFLAITLGRLLAKDVSAEVVFQDFFTQPATNLTNSVPWIDVEGNGWQAGVGLSQLALDGSGHLADQHF